MKSNCLLFVLLMYTCLVNAQQMQWVEGYDTVVFHHNVNRNAASRDFRGPSRGLMTAGWWAAGQMQDNTVSWKTSPVPEKKATTFAFIGASCVLPSEILIGPSARLSVNGKQVLTFTLGVTKNFVWKEGPYELRYISKRLE